MSEICFVGLGGGWCPFFFCIFITHIKTKGEVEPATMSRNGSFKFPHLLLGQYTFVSACASHPWEFCLVALNTKNFPKTQVKLQLISEHKCKISSPLPSSHNPLTYSTQSFLANLIKTVVGKFGEWTTLLFRNRIQS